ncbi:MAG: phosphoribosylglycinamide formyltransferase [bacterium]
MNIQEASNSTGKYKLGFLASHEGSNMQAIIDACKNGKLKMTPALVISNNADSGALKRAMREDVPNYNWSSIQYPNESELDNKICKTLVRYSVDIVILAGYMKMIGKEVLMKYAGRILNIHPALLPKFGGKGMFGLNVHKAVIESGETETGVTVHIVDALYDHGRILNQIKIPVLRDDTPETLQKRVLKVEHEIYVDTLIKIVSGEILIKDLNI